MVDLIKVSEKIPKETEVPSGQLYLVLCSDGEFDTSIFHKGQWHTTRSFSDSVVAWVELKYPDWFVKK